VLGIVNSEIVKVTDESVQKEIDINTEVLGIVNSEIEKATDESVQEEIYINTEVLGIVNYLFLSVHSYLLLLLFHH
jgi:Pyruvate/2-oxoacid:ferredoxin oxidoreductase gamma subunit